MICDICGKESEDPYNIMLPGKPAQFLCKDCYTRELRKSMEESISKKTAVIQQVIGFCKHNAENEDDKVKTALFMDLKDWLEDYCYRINSGAPWRSFKIHPLDDSIMLVYDSDRTKLWLDTWNWDDDCLTSRTDITDNMSWLAIPYLPSRI